LGRIRCEQVGHGKKVQHDDKGGDQ
jgi:hypothetical protein